MSTIALSGSDVFILNDHVFNDLADGTVIELTFDNDIAALKTGKNGNSIYGLNETGRQAKVKIRAIRASRDDVFLNAALAQQQANFAGFPLLIGEYIKKIGDGTGNVKSDTYILSGGVFQKQVAAKTNVEGESDQSVSEYMLIFSNAPRVIT